MTQQETIMDLVRANNGILTTARAVENGISRGVLGYMVKQGTLLLGYGGLPLTSRFSPLRFRPPNSTLPVPSVT